MIECNNGTYEAEGAVSERYGNNYYHAMVSVFNAPFYIPVHCYAIRAVYRNGVCLYERGVTPIQKGLWE